MNVQIFLTDYVIPSMKMLNFRVYENISKMTVMPSYQHIKTQWFQLMIPDSSLWVHMPLC